MSKYTTQVRFIVEQASQKIPNMSIGERIDYALPTIFNFHFPIWLEDYRTTLEKKIIMHYFNKEICYETVGLWKLYLEERLNLIMPYYNELYKTVVKDYDYMTDINYTEDYLSDKLTDENSNIKNNGETTDNLVGETKDVGKDITTNVRDKNVKSLSSDLPQADYADIDYGTGLQEDTINEKDNVEVDRNNTVNSTTTGKSKSQQNSEGNLKGKINEKFLRTKTGASGAHSLTALLMEYRESLINIDKMIIEELKDLFMMIY